MGTEFGREPPSSLSHGSDGGDGGFLRWGRAREGLWVDESIKQVAIQVPAIALVVYFSLSVLKMVLDQQSRRIDKMADALQNLADKLK